MRCCCCHNAYYCDKVCQRAHWRAHKPMHQDIIDRRLLGLPSIIDDEELKSQLNDDCAVCMASLPSDHRLSSWRSCCGSWICSKCDSTNVGITGIDRCVFCREPGAKTDEFTVVRIRKLIEKNPEHADALSILGDHYKVGRGVKADSAEAHRLYTKASALGNGPASANLGDMYDQGIHGVGVDLAKSRKFFELSISQGEIVAIHNFAITLIMRGEHAEAKTKFIEAAARGFEGSINCLRMMEEDKTGVSKIEIQAAARLCQRAKEL